MVDEQTSQERSSEEAAEDILRAEDDRMLAANLAEGERMQLAYEAAEEEEVDPASDQGMRLTPEQLAVKAAEPQGAEAFRREHQLDPNLRGACAADRPSDRRPIYAWSQNEMISEIHRLSTKEIEQDANVKRLLDLSKRQAKVLLSQESEAIKNDEDLEMAWVILANVSGGDWSEQSDDWQAAVTRWRDDVIPMISRKLAERIGSADTSSAKLADPPPPEHSFTGGDYDQQEAKMVTPKYQKTDPLPIQQADPPHCQQKAADPEKYPSHRPPAQQHIETQPTIIVKLHEGNFQGLFTELPAAFAGVNVVSVDTGDMVTPPGFMIPIHWLPDAPVMAMFVKDLNFILRTNIDVRRLINDLKKAKDQQKQEAVDAQAAKMAAATTNKAQESVVWDSLPDVIGQYTGCAIDDELVKEMTNEIGKFIDKQFEQAAAAADSKRIEQRMLDVAQQVQGQEVDRIVGEAGVVLARKLSRFVGRQVNDGLLSELAGLATGDEMKPRQILLYCEDCGRTYWPGDSGVSHSICTRCQQECMEVKGP